MSISLQKNQSVSLVKAEKALNRIRLGLGWDAVKKGFLGRQREVDLDASAILLAGKAALDIVYFGQLRSTDGSATHTGDNLTGDGDGDDEQILINLADVPADITTIVLVVTSYSGQHFDEVKNVYARVNDVVDFDNEVVRYDLADTGKSTANVIAKLTRGASGWQFTALGIPATGKTAKDLVPLVLDQVA